MPNIEIIGTCPNSHLSFKGTMRLSLGINPKVLWHFRPKIASKY